MKHSIRLKITLVLALLITFTIFMTWFINRTFLSDYYLYSKKKTLDIAYCEIQAIYEEQSGKQNDKSTEEQDEDKNEDQNEDQDEIELTEDAIVRIERISSNKDVDIYVYQYYYTVFGLVFPDPSYPARENMGDREWDQLISRAQEYAYPDSNPNVRNKKKLHETDNYVIFSLYDFQKEAYYIDLIGMLDDSNIILMRTNYESIQESVTIANKFLAYIGVAAVILGILVMMILSKTFVRPILELSGIARRISNLDFSAKYRIKTMDEIGVLGSSINTLSDKLETTISELKSSNNELVNEIKKKTEIDEMRKEFLSNVSHELKTPLALIQGYAEGLKENINEDEESRDFYCEVIMDETEKMTNMVKRLLSLNELEFGNNQVHFERFDIVALIHSVLNASSILIKQREVTVFFEEQDPVYVWADEYLIQQVVSNYLSNALNHVSGARIIEIKLIHREDVVRVAVFNTGENIPDEEIEKIWVKFYKVDKARTREYGGNGIGLSIVKAIMNSLNRECGVINRSVGVEFWFELDTKTE